MEFVCVLQLPSRLFTSLFVWLNSFGDVVDRQQIINIPQYTALHNAIVTNQQSTNYHFILGSILSYVLRKAELRRGECLWPLVAWFLIGGGPTSDFPHGDQWKQSILATLNLEQRSRELQLERGQWRSKTSKNSCWKPHVVSRRSITTVKSLKTLHSTSPTHTNTWEPPCDSDIVKGYYIIPASQQYCRTHTHHPSPLFPPSPISHLPFSISHFPPLISHFPPPISHLPFPIPHLPFPISL